MAAIYLASWGVFGVFAHGLAHGLRQKSLNYKPFGYVISSAMFIGVGYFLQGVRESQHELINKSVASLARERLERGVDFSRE